MNGQTTLLIAYNNCVYLEVAHAVSILKDPTLIVATLDGSSVRVGEGWKLAADVSFAEAPLEQVKAVLVPGGDIFEVKDSIALDHLLLGAYAAGAVVGGICNGALLVAKSGILRGKRMTHVANTIYAPSPDFRELIDYATPHLSGSTYVDENVVADGRIVTAKPWAAISFASALAKLCSVFEDAQAESWELYQKGCSK